METRKDAANIQAWVDVAERDAVMAWCKDHGVLISQLLRRAISSATGIPIRDRALPRGRYSTPESRAQKILGKLSPEEQEALRKALQDGHGD